MTPEDQWFDDEAGSVIRPYAVTRGRTKAFEGGLDLISLIVTVADPDQVTDLEPEHREILVLCASPTSLAEVSARLDVPAGVVRVLIDDLLERGLVACRRPDQSSKSPDRSLLRAVIAGIRAL